MLAAAAAGLDPVSPYKHELADQVQAQIKRGASTWDVDQSAVVYYSFLNILEVLINKITSPVYLDSIIWPSSLLDTCKHVRWMEQQEMFRKTKITSSTQITTRSTLTKCDPFSLSSCRHPDKCPWFRSFWSHIFFFWFVPISRSKPMPHFWDGHRSSFPTFYVTEVKSNPPE